MNIKKKSESKQGIPTGSLADIVFLLLLFFMVSTVFKQYQGLKVRLPMAEISEKVPTRKHITHIYADRGGSISVDDKMISPFSLNKIVRLKLIVLRTNLGL